MVDTPEPLDDMSFLVSITGKMTHIVGASLREINLCESDKGVAALCIRYAVEIDNGTLATLAKLGPLLLQAMESLQMSPKARAQASKGAINVQPPATKLTNLRNEIAERRERKNRTSDLDASSS